MSDPLIAELDETFDAACAAIGAATSIEALDDLQTRHLGRKGTLTLLLRRIGGLPPAAKGAFGKRANAHKVALEQAIEARRAALQDSALLADFDFDPSTPGLREEGGHEHPVLRMRREIEDVFLSMGFRVLDGPELETEYYNFEALNIPEHHPARDLQDTFFAETRGEARWVMRTHTSPMQIRAMERFGVPIRVIVPGRVYRNESTDATHESAFHQVEGLVVDRGISVAHMKGTLQGFLGAIFGREVSVRLRPHYFPFVEPGFELDFRCVFCDGGGCAKCKRTGWIELLGCGMVHAKVLQAAGVDAEEYTGFAFGCGIDRLTMMRHAIEDIRHFHAGSLRFFEQF